MNPGVAICTTPVHHAIVVTSGSSVPGCRQNVRVNGRSVLAIVMALLAEFRRADLQQLRIDRAVRFVAIATVFQNRRVLPEKRTTALGVATVAILIQRALDQLFGIGRAVRIVAAGAGHLAFAEGHMRRAL